MPLRRSAAFLCVGAIITSLSSGIAEEPHSSRPTFKAKVNVVLLDVTATDATGHPVTGLHSDDFAISENGKPQTIASFEEHQNQPGSPVEKRSPLPEHFYTNTPQSSGSIDVLLLDSLNTELSDQATVRLQMIDYLKKIDPGPQLAIFTLGSQLRLVEGFTSSPKALIEALNHKQWGGVPKPSIRKPRRRITSTKRLSRD